MCSECVPSNVLLDKMICYKIHICDTYYFHELPENVSLDFVYKKMIFRKSHIMALMNCLMCVFKCTACENDLPQE